MKKIILISLLSVNLQIAQGQSLSLGFPHFAGQEWTLSVFRGEKSDTIASGQLDGTGKSRIVLPEEYKNHRGMMHWMLRNAGGLGVIMAGGENVTVSCSEIQPSQESIIYTDSPENTYLDQHFKHQQEILGKIDAMRMASQSYKGDHTSSLLSIFNNELLVQEQNYTRLQEQTASSPLYAARFTQIADITRGLPPALSSDMQENEKRLMSFILEELDMQALYTSGHWKTVLSQWLDWYTLPQNETQLIADYQNLKKRINNKEVLVAFESTIQKLLSDKNRNDLLLLTGDRKAPVLSQGRLPNKKTILVFYESGCGPCETQMQELRANYSQLISKGYEIISISSDKDKAIFANTAETFPWKNKYCDYEGFAGKDFINYGVRGTPTFFLIDEKGMISGIYAQVEDMKL